MPSVFEKQKPEISARTQLKEIYLDWFNNYLSIERYAERNGLTYGQAEILLGLAKEVSLAPHPES